jgi:hypothetical protein
MRYRFEVSIASQDGHDFLETGHVLHGFLMVSSCHLNNTCLNVGLAELAVLDG